MTKIKSKRELLFSLGPKDFKWEFYRASGPGGQHRNKRDTACRCTHKPSGAVGVGADERYQRRNRVLAFKRCVNSERFKTWHSAECFRLLRDLKTKEEIERLVNEELNNLSNLKFEVKNKQGQWVEVSIDEINN